MLLSFMFCINTIQANGWKHRAKQDNVWACHVFVVIGLLEAEYYEATGVKINLSEADLFLRHLKNKSPNWDEAVTQYLRKGIKIKDPRLLEIGRSQKDFLLVQKYGVAMEQEIKYSALLKMGIPMALELMRDSVAKTKKVIIQGEKPSLAIDQQLSRLKKEGVFKILKQEELHFNSRSRMKDFALGFSYKEIDVRNDFKIDSIKHLMKTKHLGLVYTASERDEHSHMVIITGYDEARKEFFVRDSASKKFFRDTKVSLDYLQKNATNVIYLSKK